MLPPHELSAPSWAHAYAAFYAQLGGGRPLESFHNSLKATRDAFDSWVDSGRRGWRSPDGTPKPLHDIEQAAMNKMTAVSRADAWAYVSGFVDQRVSDVPARVLADA